MHKFKTIIMRSTLFITLLCIAISMVSANEVLSQEKKETNIRLSLTNASVITVIEAISKQTGYTFFYNEAYLSKMAPITMKISNATLEQVLNQVSKQTNLSFRKVDDTFTVIPPPEPAKPEMTAPKQQQGIRVTGTVSDNYGELLPGVSVVVRGTTIGINTDANGEFSLTVPSDTSVLLFSYIGYKMQEVVVGNRRIIAITMQEDISELGEVTIVAFGTQKKESVVASITTIDPSSLKVPSSNLTTSFAGNIAGMISYQRSGEPGQDNADFFIRGVTTFGYKTSPLILIDGIELSTTDLARIHTDDIASFSILKDAAATALYGARGANGVILVTTKQGKEGKTQLNFRIENSWSSPTQNVELADPVTYMRLGNEAVLTRDPLGITRYSDKKIAGTEAGLDPLLYPANDWRAQLFKNYAMNQRANLNISGGGSIAKYFVSASFSKDNGILKVDNRNNFNNNIDLKKYTLRSNININVTKSTELIVRLSGNFDNYTGPIGGGSDMYNMVMHSNPALFPAYYPANDRYQYVNHIMFGNYDLGQYVNPYAQMVRGYKDYNRSQMIAQLDLRQDLSMLTKGLSARAMLNITRDSYYEVSRAYNPYYYELSYYDPETKQFQLNMLNEDAGSEYLGWSEGEKTVDSDMYVEAAIDYNRTFGEKHGISGLLVFILKDKMTANASNLQETLPYRNVGLSGRLTYSFDSRYFGEFNFGYNGSERFHKSKRFGFFPSAGIGWNISNEQFWSPLKKTVSNLKLRGTYGLAGNDAIGSAADRFFFMSIVNMNDGGKMANFGENNGSYRRNGVTIERYANNDITWEVSEKKNIALEIGLWNKVNIIAELFSEYRKNILMDRMTIPNTTGLNTAGTYRIRANTGEASGKGTDISIDYQHSFSTDFWLTARGNFTYATSQYEVYEEPAYVEYWRFRKGNALSQTFGYIAEKLFTDDAEVAKELSINNMFYLICFINKKFLPLSAN